ncbi:restriction endonuclease subunit S [Mammaliicoccus sciuri]
MEFKKYKIQEIGEVIGGGTPSTKKSEYYGGNIPWITPKDLSNFKEVFISEGERNITEEGLKNSSARTLPSNTVLMTSRAPIGYLAIAKNEVTTNQGFKSIICNESLVKPLFLYYSLKNDMDKIKSLGTGSTFSEISGKVVKNIEINIPSIEYQTIIEYILGNFDKKIELNQKIIANLEELSQTLFKRWFVDFEFPDENGNPYKSSGGEMIDSELGEIPSGWKVDELGNYIKIKSGKRPKNKVDKKDIENVVPIIGASKIMGYTNDYLYNEKIIIIGRVGTHGVIQRFSTRTWPSDNTFVIISDFESIIYQVLKSIDYISLNRGSTQPLLSQKDIKNTKVVMPTNATLLSKYQKENNHILKMMDQKNKENKKITKLRDTLLPKLMSGEIEIPDDIEVNEDELSI